VAKAGIAGLTRFVTFDDGTQGIRANALAPTTI
jgi:NAD(P)-dependent dehydrogenase (short-subunit alcohol dehydrogenase family)